VLDDGVGAVGRRVGADQDLEVLRRVVLREQVLDPLRDAGRLVVGGDEH